MTRPIIGLALGICISGAIATDAIGHGEADWIGKGGYVSPTTNVSCCNIGKDCQRLDPRSVRPTGGGYAVLIGDYTVMIPFNQTLRSIDRDYWVCTSPVAPQSIRCFFAPFTGGVNAAAN